jgi:hypothetical protein
LFESIAIISTLVFIAIFVFLLRMDRASRREEDDSRA